MSVTAIHGTSDQTHTATGGWDVSARNAAAEVFVAVLIELRRGRCWGGHVSEDANVPLIV
jgi:hypothetical protein